MGKDRETKPSKEQKNLDLQEEIIKNLRETGVETRSRGDILLGGQGKSAKIAVTSTGSGLKGQEKTPKDLRSETFVVPKK